MKHKINQNKHLFYRIFDKQPKETIDFITCNGKMTYDEVLESHLDSWIANRIKGISSSMAFYAEIPEALRLIDDIAKDYFNIKNLEQ